ITAKMEMGSPMASLYLFGNPDHYTGHQFKHQCILEKLCQSSKKCMELPTENEGSTKAILSQNNGKLIALSNVQDYIYQPQQKFDDSLKTKNNECNSDDMLDDNDELNLFDKNDLVDVNHDKQVNSLGGGIDTTSSSEDELNVINNDSYESVNVSHYLPFLKRHPQYKTHHVCCIEDNDRIVPNFIGGSLPHQDQGDCEYYCSTMLFT
ncbi:hypothetical protein JOM56_013181, partial [Amanita muscaria]